ncbi:MAG: thioredoxin family protein [Candidatus Aquicultor sp.]
MPYLEDWHKKYSDKGFTLIGVHSPEFDFEREPDNVRWALRYYGLTYPVVLDSHFRIWHAYQNAYWPRKYLVLNGSIVYDHIGEGDYHATEAKLRNLLEQINPEIDLADIPVVQDRTATCTTPTEETYCGYSRGFLNNPGGYHKMEDFAYEDPGDYVRSGLYLKGRWRAERQYLEHVGPDPSGHLVLPIEAVSVNLVMTSSAPEPVQVAIEFNGHPLTEETMGDDVTGSKVSVVEPRMYNLFRAGTFTSGILRLTNLPNGLRLYAFSFGGCVGVP